MALESRATEVNLAGATNNSSQLRTGTRIARFTVVAALQQRELVKKWNRSCSLLGDFLGFPTPVEDVRADSDCLFRF